MKPGIHQGIPSSLYHADCADTPSLSSSIAKLLLERPPLWAWTAHPKLNPDFKPSEPKAAFDIGSAAHAGLLECGAGVMLCPFDDWRSKAAQAMRDEAREKGMTPMLTKEYEKTQEMSRVATEFLKYHGIDVSKTDNELTMIAEVDGVLCRTRNDIFTPGRIIDYKTTGLNLDVFNRQASKFGYDLQAAMYLRVAAELGYECDWLFLVQETTAPYPCQMFSPTREFLEIGRRRFNYALQIWSNCLLMEDWPGYDRTFQLLDAMPWDLNDLNSEHENNLLNGVE